MRALILAISLAAIVGCQSSAPTVAPTVHPESVATKDVGMLGQISQLVGDWTMTDENGNKQTASVFAVTGGGSAVREVMFPGAKHEMMTLYHMDGDALVCTHYCAAGNQPRMVAAHAVTSEEGTAFHFEFDSVSNLRESHDHYMGKMTLTILNDGRIRQDWRSFDRSNTLTEPVSFLLERGGSSPQ